MTVTALLTSTPDPKSHNLTLREYELLQLLARGLSTCGISQRMVITQATVKFHLRNIYHKLGTKTRAETIEYALRNYLLPEG